MRRLDRVERGVVALAALALLARLVGLGTRPFHWDEARVGYWALRSLETGVYEYRPVAGGPFLYVVGRRLFALGLTSDAAARFPVAL
ncbi:TIGR03663 family protein, partial [Halolamina salina]